jgi:dTDP-glucose pyrophosphorylase
MIISRAIITAAGEGSRMKKVTAVVPKALLPLFKTEGESRIIVPVADLIMESLMSAGVSNFCFVVGKHRALLMDYLFERDVTFVFQNQPKGFGDAVLRGEDFASRGPVAGRGPVFIHADDGVLTGGYKEAVNLYAKKNADGVLLLRKTSNPKRYGIAEIGEEFRHMGHKAFQITGVQEKPSNPKSNLLISAVYILSHRIFDSIRKSSLEHGELQLTSGIQNMILDGRRIYGIALEKEQWLNVGDTESYHKALEYSFKNL